MHGNIMVVKLQILLCTYKLSVKTLCFFDTCSQLHLLREFSTLLIKLPNIPSPVKKPTPYPTKHQAQTQLKGTQQQIQPHPHIPV